MRSSTASAAPPDDDSADSSDYASYCASDAGFNEMFNGLDGDCDASGSAGRARRAELTRSSTALNNYEEHGNYDFLMSECVDESHSHQQSDIPMSDLLKTFGPVFYVRAAKGFTVLVKVARLDFIHKAPEEMRFINVRVKIDANGRLLMIRKTLRKTLCKTFPWKLVQGPVSFACFSDYLAEAKSRGLAMGKRRITTASHPTTSVCSHDSIPVSSLSPPPTSGGPPLPIDSGSVVSPCSAGELTDGGGRSNRRSTRRRMWHHDHEQHHSSRLLRCSADKTTVATDESAGGNVPSSRPTPATTTDHHIEKMLRKPGVAFGVKKKSKMLVCLVKSENTRENLLRVVRFYQNYFGVAGDLVSSYE